jgi:hypothetical protein
MNFSKIICVLILTCFSFSCKENPASSDNTCTPIINADQYIELIYPIGGETLKLGSTVKMQWKVNKNKVSQVVVQLSTDNKKTWKDMFPLGLAVNGNNGDCACMEENWVVGSETEAIGYNTAGETKVFFRVGKYGEANSVNATTSVSISVVP